MAGQVARGLGKQLVRLNLGGYIPSGHAFGLRTLYNLRGAVLNPPWYSRGISQFPRTQYQSTHLRGQRVFDEEEEKEDEYDVDDDSLDELRKQHRATASKSHNSQEGKTFSDFPLDAALRGRLEVLGYTQPFEIQAVTLEHTLAGRDVIGRALTGSGKTLAFSIPIVHKILQRSNARSSRNPKAIVISPTRELCMQIYRSIQELNSRVRCVAVYGGDSIIKQERNMRRGVDVICATPGRLNDHIQRGNINLNELEFLCLDEADELLTPGFKEQIENVLETSPDNKQVMLFSATLPPHIQAITRQYMNDPVHVDITSDQKYKAPESVRHLCIKVPRNQHLFVVKSLIDEHKPKRCIVFMETKHITSESAHMLRSQMGLKADGIHSDLSQSRRENIMSAFRAGVIKILVATDVAARGLDIPEVDLVIQASPPRNGVEYYIHRSGRTGRGGREGLAVLLHSGTYEDRSIVQQIEKLAKVEHVEPPNQEAVIENSAKAAIHKLQQQSSRRSNEKILPLVEDLKLSPEATQRLLATAVMAMVNGTSQFHKSGPTRPPFKKPFRSQPRWDDDEYPRRSPRDRYSRHEHYTDRNSRARSSRHSSLSDWSEFY